MNTFIPESNSAMDRIRLATGCRTQSELAELFGIRQSSISDAKRRGSIPSDWLLKLLQLKGVNPDWILTGEGAKYLQEKPADGTPPYLQPRQPEVKEEPQVLRQIPSEQLLNELLRRYVVKARRGRVYPRRVKRDQERVIFDMKKVRDTF